jgi:hypothetical protein
MKGARVAKSTWSTMDDGTFDRIEKVTGRG